LTLEKIQNMGWEVLPHPPHSPELAPPNYHLLRGQHYKTNKAHHTAVRQCLLAARMEFYYKGIFKLPERWEKCVQMYLVFA
jgi:hypothetical protein